MHLNNNPNMVFEESNNNVPSSNSFEFKYLFSITTYRKNPPITSRAITRKVKDRA